MCLAESKEAPMGKSRRVALAIWAAVIIVGSGFECWRDYPKRVGYLTGLAYLVARFT